MTATTSERGSGKINLGWITKHHTTILLLSMLALFPYGTSHQVPMIILAMIGLISAFRANAQAWRSDEVRLFLIVYGALFFPLLIASFNAADAEHAWSTTGRYFAIFFVVLAVLLNGQHQRFSTPLLWGILVILSVWVADGLIQYFSGKSIMGDPLLAGRVTGPFYPDHRIGIFLAHFAPFYLELIRRLSAGRPWLWLLIIPYTTVILLGGVRSSWITILMVFIAYGIYLAVIYRISWKRIAVLAMALVITGFIMTNLSPGLQDRLGRTAGLLTLDFDSWNHATSGRMTIWSAAVRVFADHWPIGVGPRGFTSIAMDAGYMDLDFSHVHLFALEIPVTTGVVGLAGYLLTFAVLALAYLRLKKLKAALFAPWLAIALALFPLNAHWHFYGTFFTSMFWLIFMIAMIMTREEKRAHGDPRGISP